ncbi:GTP pyrophosphokinase [Clostridium butyricum]|uniref:GTP pyrophosphokinase n=1 Tax=Clostridium butyricum TaxID=1492 RepID=UPI003D33093E
MKKEFEDMMVFEIEDNNDKISDLEIGDGFDLLSLPDIDFEVWTVANLKRTEERLWIFTDFNERCGIGSIDSDKVMKEINDNEDYEVNLVGSRIEIIIRDDMSLKELNILWNRVKDDYFGYAIAIQSHELYKNVKNKIIKKLPVYERAKNKIILELDSYSKEVDNNECKIIEVVGRTKDIQSIEEKVYRKNICSSRIFERFDDIAGVRVICEYISDVYKVLEYIKQNPLVQVIQIEDKIKTPTNEGYRGIHVIVVVDVFYGGNLYNNIKVEIQLRTSFQNAWAMKTHNLTYKREEQLSNDVLSQMKDLSEYLYNADKKAQELKDILI